MILLYHWKWWFHMISLKHQNWFIYFKIAWWNGETPSLHMKDQNVLQAPEVVIALLGHGAMMAKFCHLEASPQNNEACGWLAGADGCGWRSKKWSSLAVYLLGVSETMLVFMSLQSSYESWTRMKTFISPCAKTLKKNWPSLTGSGEALYHPNNQTWEHSVAGVAREARNGTDGSQSLRVWFPTAVEIVLQRFNLQRLVSDFKLSFCQCMKQHAEPRIMPIKTGRLRWIEWNLAILSSHSCSEAPGVQQSWRLRHRSWAIWARGMWLAHLETPGEQRTQLQMILENGTFKLNSYPVGDLGTDFSFFWLKSDWAQVDSCRVGFNVPEFLDLARWPRKSRLQTVRLGTFLNCAGLHVYRERSCITCILYLYWVLYPSTMCDSMNACMWDVCVCVFLGCVAMFCQMSYIPSTAHSHSST